MEGLDAKRKFGIQNFDDYLEEVFGFDYGGFKMLPKQSQKSIREGFRNQKGMIHGQQQLDMYNKPYIDEDVLQTGYKADGVTPTDMTGYHESWVEEIINDYLNDSMEARELGLLNTFLDDKTARGFGAGVNDIVDGAGVRKIGEEVIDENPIKRDYKRAITENPIPEQRAKAKRANKKAQKNKPKP